MDFSIILASRERVSLLKNLIKSIKETASDISKIEVLVAIDDDDTDTHLETSQISKNYNFVRFESRKRSRFLNLDYINWLATDHSTGKYLIIVNDDVEFKTKHWDDIIREKLDVYLADKPDGIVYGYIDDGHKNKNGLGYCCFPLVSKAGVNASGICMPPECAAWNADAILWRIYVRIERICDLSDVKLAHFSYHNGTRDCDNINLHVQSLSQEPHTVNIGTYYDKLRNCIQEQQIIDLVRSNYMRTIEYHQASGYNTDLDFIWSNNMSDIGNIVKNAKSAYDLIDMVDQTFMYSINFPPENGQNSGIWTSPNDVPHIRKRQIAWLLAKQKEDGIDVFAYPDHVQESIYIHDRNKTIINHRILSGNFLRTLSIAQRIINKIGKESINSVIELGAGCGHQARTINLLIPHVKYTIVDLPETLMFSFAHTKLSFPNKKILYISSEEDVNNIDDYDFVFCPAVFAHLLHGRSYDLFINTASMGEMTNSTIHRWMDFIQNKINLKYLFTLNRFLNVVDEGLGNQRRNENECSVCYDHKWQILNWELEPIYTRCPYIDTLHSRYLEIIAKRGEDVDQNTMIQISDGYLASALDEDWYRLKGYYGNGVMQYRANVLVTDTTLSGTLFKLWESIRFNKNVNNVNAMIEYLNRLLVRQFHTFEELLYYNDLLNKLQG